jgi:hypothetical protein
MGIRDKPTAPASPWQNGFVERLIGSIRRECVDHIIVLGEMHLRRVLKTYADYYNCVRTHRSLNKDAPVSRPVQRTGVVSSRAILGGLHHRYARVYVVGTPNGRKPEIGQTNRKRSVLLRSGRFGVRRRSTLTCCRRTRFSASSVALALKREARIPRSSLNRLVIRMPAYAVRLLRLRRIEFSVHADGVELSHRQTRTSEAQRSK